ncbi:MAG: type II toxin-antitoxin system death-on-curing family toxin [Rubrivivax sp.]|jgi:death-on-curing protein
MSSNQSWVWLSAQVLLAVHDEQLSEHGGAPGTRDESLFHSAMARPLNLAAYGTPDAADLAASYGFGLARNHAFVDGNKRTAFVAVELFLALNGHCLDASDSDCVIAMLALAAGTLSEAEFADWLRRHLQPR